MTIAELFTVEYPKTLVYDEMTPADVGINFVSSQGKDNGVVSKVAEAKGVKIYPAGVITVPLKGTVLCAHLQPKPCYVAHQIAVLTAKKAMSTPEKLFYCACIRRNAFRFSYGRQAYKTLKDIALPDAVPEWTETVFADTVHQNIRLLQKLN